MAKHYCQVRAGLGLRLQRHKFQVRAGLGLSLLLVNPLSAKLQERSQDLSEGASASNLCCDSPASKTLPGPNGRPFGGGGSRGRKF